LQQAFGLYPPGTHPKTMARMFGFIGNRADLGARVLEANRSLLKARRTDGEPLGWGLGFYQSGEVLLRRRPIDDRAEIDLVEAAEDVRTDAWLFAQTGTIVGFERLRSRLLESQPEFLRRNVRGETDSECFFYLFLSFLHDAGHLDDAHVQGDHVAAALRASIALVDRLSAEEGHAENSGDILVTNGEQLIAVNRSDSMVFRRWKGRFEMEELLGEEGLRKARIPSIDSSCFSLLACDIESAPAGFQAPPRRSIVHFTRSDEPRVEPL
jgi:glutamine amidotransferase